MLEESGQLTRLNAALAERYHVERELGHGGMATVYLAEDLKHHRPVAIKVLRPELAAALGPERFAREIEVAARLQHPHILPLLDSGHADGFYFYVMPFVQGESLRERLAREGALAIPDAVRVLLEVADALSEAHAHGVVHRDIKPDNVMLRGRHALVTDFGVAKAVTEATGQLPLTSSGVALGTPKYMAPEQATADPHQDHRVDIYALGVLGYEVLTGRAPFAATTAAEMLAAHVTAEPDPVEQHRPTVPEALGSVVMKCLAKKPADRWQTANELVRVLEPLAGPSGETTPHSLARSRPLPRLRSMGVGAALLLAAAWAGWRAFRPRPVALSVANLRQVTHDAVPDLYPAISPDGREVAYESGPRGDTHIVVRDVAGGRPLAVTAGWRGSQLRPAWFPNGRDLLVTEGAGTADHSAGLWKLSRLGGQEVLADSADRTALEGGASVAVVGDSIVFRARDGRVSVVHAKEIHSPAVRQDGEALAFVAGNLEGLDSWGNIAPSAIWVVVAGHAAVRVTDTTSLNTSPAWLPDGALLFVSDRDGARDIYALRLDRAGHHRETASRLTSGAGAYSVSVSADGSTIAYDVFALRRNIYALPIPRAGTASLRDARPVTTGNQIIEEVAVSADGRWLAFDSDVGGHQDIYVMPATGGEPRQVTRDAGDNFSPDFSPDGQEITFHSTRNATRDVYVINRDGSNERRLTSDSEQSMHPAFSPDGLAIAYGAPLRVVRRAAPGAPWRAPSQVLVENGFAPRWSPDGSSLAYYPVPTGGVGIYQFGEGARTLVAAGTAGLEKVEWPTWSEDGARIYFRATGPGGTQGLYVVPVRGGPPRLVVRFDDASRRVGLGGVVRNGMYYCTLGEYDGDVWVADLVRR